jgi:lipopolysaccharide transport system ATP-binding protein
MQPAIRVESLSKLYRMGNTHVGSLRELISGATSRLLGRQQELLPHEAAQVNGRKNADENEFWALRDVSFEVQPGEIVGIIGRNGAGKSTLLKILSRITSPTHGHIATRGRVASLLEVGTGFHPELTGRENVFLNGAILGMTKAEIRRKFDEIVDFAELDAFIDTPVKRYSSGMYVRLAFAVAAHLEPEILIIDEVLAVGDIDFQQKCLGRLQTVASRGRTVLFVSHNMLAIQRLCSRTVLLENGSIQLDGLPQLIIDAYSDNAQPLSAFHHLPIPTTTPPIGFATQLVIEDAHGIPAPTIPLGKPWQLRIYFTVCRPLKHFIVGIGLKTNSGVPVRTTWSEPRPCQAGSYCAIFREDNVHLACGQYAIAVGLSDFQRSFYYSDDAGRFAVVFSKHLLTAVPEASDIAHGIVVNPMTSCISLVNAQTRPTTP